MNRGIALLCALGVAVMPLFAAYGQLSRSMRQIPIGNSDYQGYARIDKIIYKMDLGGGEDADIYFKFTSDPSIEPKYMGIYWEIPFFETKATQESKNRYIWKSPNYGTYTFNREPKAEKGYKETYILNTTGRWKLNVGAGGIDINNTDDPKHIYRFKDGKLASFCPGNGGDTFRIVYSKGKPQYIYNATKNEEAMRLFYNSDMLLEKITFPKDKKSINIRYGPCDTYGADGASKQGGLYKSVSSITYTDGTVEEYKYSAEDAKGRKYLTSDGKEGERDVPVNKIEVFREGKSGGYIEWDAASGLIIADSGGVYAVRNPLLDKLNPEYEKYEFYRKSAKRTQESRISYKKPEYKYAEIWDYNSRNAVKITQDPNTGEQTRISYIGTPGNASMKVRKIEKKLANGKNWKVELSKFYNDKGQLIREINSRGDIKEFMYDSNGKHRKTIENGLTTYESRILKNGNIEICEQDSDMQNRIKRIIFPDGQECRIEFVNKEKIIYTIYRNSHPVITYYEIK